MSFSVPSTAPTQDIACYVTRLGTTASPPYKAKD
jgi:hypothetical protein